MSNFYSPISRFFDRSFLFDLLFPKTCAFCLNACGADFHILCQDCFSEITLENPSDRCRRCFQPIRCCVDTPIQHRCFGKNSPLRRHAFCCSGSPLFSRALHALNDAAFEISGPQAIAGFFVLQHILLQFPPADALLLFPIFKKKEQDRACAERVGELLSIPHVLISETALEDLPQASIQHLLCINERSYQPNIAAQAEALGHLGIRSLDWLSLYSLE